MRWQQHRSLSRRPERCGLSSGVREATQRLAAPSEEARAAELWRCQAAQPPSTRRRTMRTPITGAPVSGPLASASLKPFSIAGTNSGGMFVPIISLSNSAGAEGLSSGSM